VGDKLPYPLSNAEWARANRDLRIIGCHPFAQHTALLGFGMIILLFLFQILGQPPVTAVKLNILANKAAKHFP